MWGEMLTMILVPATPSAMVESVERGPRVREIGSLFPGRVNPIIYQIDTCRFLANHKASDKDLFDQCQDNVTEWDIW